MVRKVKLTTEQNARLAKVAAAQGVTVARLMVETTLAKGGHSPATRRALFAELLGLRSDLARIGNNLNQIAHRANIDGRVGSDAIAAIARLQGADEAIERTMRELRA